MLGTLRTHAPTAVSTSLVSQAQKFPHTRQPLTGPRADLIQAHFERRAGSQPSSPFLVIAANRPLLFMTVHVKVFGRHPRAI
jgi:hypothetical protein